MALTPPDVPEIPSLKGLYPCTQCSRTFNKDNLRQAHERDAHRSSSQQSQQDLICQRCGYSCTSRKAFGLHQGTAHKNRPHVCNICCTDFVDTAKLKAHVKKHEENPCWCKACIQMFKTAEELNEHKKLHPFDVDSIPIKRFPRDPDALDYKKPYQCEYCLESFASAQNIRIHQHTRHEPDMTQCAICKSTLESSYRLKQHVFEVHTKQQFKCTACYKKFGEERALQEHQMICGAKITSSNELQTESGGDSSVLRPKTISSPSVLAEELHASIHANVASIRSFVALSIHQTLPRTTTAAQQCLMGKNMQKFENAQCMNPLSALVDPSRAVSENLQRFLEQKSIHALFAAFLKGKDDVVATIVIKNFKDKPYPSVQEVCCFDVQAENFDTTAGKFVSDNLRRLLERTPGSISTLNIGHRKWLISAAIACTFATHPGLKVRLSFPQLMRPDTQSASVLASKPKFSYGVVVRAFDPAKNKPWTKTLGLPIGVTDVSKTVAIPNESRYEWIGARPGSDAPESKYHTYGEVKQSFRLAQSLTVRYLGFMGTVRDLSASFTKAVQEFWSIGKQQTREHLNQDEDEHGSEHAIAEKWDGQKFFKTSHVEAGYTLISPSAWMERMMKIKTIHIVLDSVEPERQHLVLTGMLEAFKNGHPADTVWGTGCCLADQMNCTVGSEPPLIVACTDNDPQHREQLHVCPRCLGLCFHSDLKFIPEVPDYQICSQCQNSIRLDIKDLSLEGGIVGYNLWVKIKQEDRHSGTRKTNTELKQEFDEAFRALQVFRLDPTRWNDAYAEQVLPLNGPKDLTWDGCRYSPLHPSVEAVDPFVIGDDGLTHYHVKGNLVTLSDALNRAKKHFPPVVLYGMSLLTGSQRGDSAIYETGIAVLRTSLINHYEYGHLGSPQQNSRIAKIAPANYHAIAKSFRTPLLLRPQTVNKETVWRTTNSKTNSFSPNWRHPHHEWIMFQIDMAAAEIFDNSAELWRFTFMRKDSTGSEVFFPFSQYSIVNDFTWKELFELLSERAIRNVNECQRSYSRKSPIPQFSSEELLLVLVYVWMYMVKSDIEKGIALCDYGTDEVGAVPHPNLNSPLCASLGHRWPGQVQKLGLVGFDMNIMEKVTFLRNECGFMWETQFCNFMKYKYNVDSLPVKVFPQLAKIRRQNQFQIGGLPVLPERYERVYLTGDLADPFSSGQLTRQVVHPVSRKLSPQNAAAISNTIDLASNADEEIAEAVAETTMSTVGQELPPFTPSRIAETFEADSDEEREPADEGIEETSILVPESVRGSGFEPSVLSLRVRNLQNLGLTCYLSAVIQVLAHVDGLFLCIDKATRITLNTGRNPALLQSLGDVNGSSHSLLCVTLCKTITRLKEGTSKLAGKETLELLNACYGLSNRWKNEMNESSDLYTWLMDRMNIVGDVSSPVSRPDIWEKLESGIPRKRPAYRPEEEMNFELTVISANSANPGNPKSDPLSLTGPHWHAHLASGHHSAVTQLTGIQHFDQYTCSSEACNTVQADISYSYVHILHIPQDAYEDQSFPISSLVKQSLRTAYLRQSTFDAQVTPTLDRAKSCLNTAQHAREHASVKGEFLSQLTVITRAPPILTFEIRRQRSDPTFESIENSFPFMNTITNYQHLNLGNILTEELRTMGFTGAARTQKQGQFWEAALNAEYDIVAIVAYSDDAKHYTSFVLIQNQWIYFDDVAEYPVHRNPFDDWPHGFTQSMLWYNRVGEGLAPDITETDATVTPRPDSMTGLSPNTPPGTATIRAESPEDDLFAEPSTAQGSLQKSVEAYLRQVASRLSVDEIMSLQGLLLDICQDRLRTAETQALIPAKPSVLSAQTSQKPALQEEQDRHVETMQDKGTRRMRVKKASRDVLQNIFGKARKDFITPSQGMDLSNPFDIATHTDSDLSDISPPRPSGRTRRFSHGIGRALNLGSVLALSGDAENNGRKTSEIRPQTPTNQKTPSSKKESLKRGPSPEPSVSSKRTRSSKFQ